MKKNEILVGKCVDYTHEGFGIVKVEGFIYFVKNVIVDEEVEFVVTKVNKSYGYGKVMTILTPSVNRVEPFCEYYGRCGGCQLQHMNAIEQARFKKNLVQNNIHKIAGIAIDVNDVIQSDVTQNYRNKAQFPISIQDKQVAMGFYRMHSNDIIDMNACPIQCNTINNIFSSIKTLLKKIGFKNQFRHVLIKYGFETNEAMVVFVCKNKVVPGLDYLVKQLCEMHCEIKSVILNVNKRKDNVILGDEEYLLFGKDYISDTLNALSFHIASRSFYQVNPKQTIKLYEQVLNFAQLSKEDLVIDLYCGVGTISLFLAKAAKKVIGIEVVDAAIENAKANALRNHIDNVDFVCSDAGHYAKLLTQEGVKPNVVVVDPPRKGCDSITLDSIVAMQPELIVYVSCNPATLARDLKYLDTLGYKTSEVQPVDMFLHTFHVESIVMLCRR